MNTPSSPERQKKQEWIPPLEGTLEFRKMIAHHVTYVRDIIENKLKISLSIIEQVMLRHALEGVAHQYFTVGDRHVAYFEEAESRFLDAAFGFDSYTVFLEMNKGRDLFREWMRRHHEKLHHEF